MRILFTGGDVWLHDEVPNAAARDVLVEDGRITAVGERGSLSSRDAEVADLEGGLLMPAFFDGHLHLEFGGKGLRSLQLSGVRRAEDVIELVAGHAQGGDGWILGQGLHERAWPPLEELHRAAGNRPMLLHTRDYHSAFLSRAGLEKLGITSASEMPEGALMELGPDGAPTGVFRENAVTWIEEQMPEDSEAQRLVYIEAAIEHIVNLGVLGVSGTSSRDDWHLLSKLDEEGRLLIRVESWAQCLDLDDVCLEMSRGESERLRRSRIKVFLDGAMGSRSAWMREAYSDDPGMHPGPVPDLDRFKHLLAEGVKKGWSFTVHAIGDAAVAFALDSLSGLPAPGGPHRVEHVQHVDLGLIAHPAWETLIPSIQPHHRTEDLGMLVDRVGRERAAHSFPARSLWRESRPLALGTDWPVISADPLHTIRSALLPRGDGEGMPGEELTLAQAVDGVTRGAARAAGFMGMGEIAVGADADLVLLRPNPLQEGWHQTKVTAIWRAGMQIKD